MKDEETVMLRDEHPCVERFDPDGQPVVGASPIPPPAGERSLLDTNIVQPSLLGPAAKRPVRQNKILREP